MNDNTSNTAIGITFWLIILALSVFFIGEPDIHDAIIHYLMNRGG